MSRTLKESCILRIPLSLAAGIPSMVRMSLWLEAQTSLLDDGQLHMPIYPHNPSQQPGAWVKPPLTNQALMTHQLTEEPTSYLAVSQHGYCFKPLSFRRLALKRAGTFLLWVRKFQEGRDFLPAASPGLSRILSIMWIFYKYFQWMLKDRVIAKGTLTSERN